MFLRSSSRPQPVECFFCLSTTLLPPASGVSNGVSLVVDRKGKGRAREGGTKWDWECDRCGCRNVRDEVILPCLLCCDCQVHVDTNDVAWGDDI